MKHIPMSVLCKGVGAVRGFDRWSYEKGLNAFSLCSVRFMYCREAAPLQLVNSGIPDLSNFIKMIWFSELIHEWLCVIRSQWWVLRCTQINLLYSYENIFFKIVCIHMIFLWLKKANTYRLMNINKPILTIITMYKLILHGYLWSISYP